MEFGSFVNFFGAKDGLVHISQLAANHVQKTSDVVKEGDKVKVKLLGFDERGKVRLSMKAVDQATGEDLEAKQKAEGTEQPREAAAGEGLLRLRTGRAASPAARRFHYQSCTMTGVDAAPRDGRLKTMSSGMTTRVAIISIL